MSQRTTWLIAILLFLVAAVVRFHRLGDWPFHGDELATQWESCSLFHGQAGPVAGQIDRLPHLIPLSHTLHYASYVVFGWDEWGSRVLPALLGSLHVMLVFWLLVRPLGTIPALASALLLAVWPEHLYRSQENRFYMTAAFLASLCMLCGAQAVWRRSAGWTWAACACALAAILAHTIQGMLLGGLFLCILAVAWSKKDIRLARLLLVVFAASIVAAGIFFVHLLPLVRGWNGGEVWGYDIAHSVMASLSQLGWPIALLALLGGLAAWQRRDEQDQYWLVWLGLWGASIVMLPVVFTYHPAYLFPLTLPPIVMAGRAVALIHDGLKEHSRQLAWAWVFLVCLLNLPSLVSHYRDGTRTDYRSAAGHLAEHWQPGDRVVAFSSKLLRYYLPEEIEPEGLSMSRPVTHLRDLSQSSNRLWIVVGSTRAGKPEPLANWLGQRCSRQLHIRKKRFDYYENTTEVFLFEPKAIGGLARK